MMGSSPGVAGRWRLTTSARFKSPPNSSDENATTPPRVHVDMIQPDPEIGDDPKRGPRRLEQLLADRDRRVDDDRGRSDGELAHSGRRRVESALDHFELRGKAFAARGRQPAGNEHHWSRGLHG